MVKHHLRTCQAHINDERNTNAYSSAALYWEMGRDLQYIRSHRKFPVSPYRTTANPHHRIVEISWVMRHTALPHW